MSRLDGGDAAALYDVTKVVIGFLRRYRAYDLQDHWDDICQEVLMAVIKAYRTERIREEKAFVNYLGATTRYKLREWIEKKRKPGTANSAGEPESVRGTRDRVLALCHADDPGLLVDLTKALDALPAQERQVVELVYLHGYSYQEASERLDLPLGTLKRLQTRGLRELREAMGVTG
ncbi:MAG: sigma-70 family RNA polymerase sigma factor [Deltaproteobacteria bacterium]|nr:sigma-70 family RNA polymerase sigma factor [Deltaproteobacteria bacterium]MBW2389937.1 sigma-70 family RNA polymerase sigma factor [Deltaproteobacteria bacterium]MBW2724088.1 sigma-70 family RNA polymerase sigma factor [Deltaproteobacteria bacterium]